MCLMAGADVVGLGRGEAKAKAKAKAKVTALGVPDCVYSACSLNWLWVSEMAPVTACCLPGARVTQRGDLYIPAWVHQKGAKAKRDQVVWSNFLKKPASALKAKVKVKKVEPSLVHTDGCNTLVAAK